MGWDNEEISYELDSTMTMRNCYKQLIASLCDRSSTWSGIDAKYFDKCTNSMYVTQVVKSGIISQPNIDMTTYRTVAPYS